MASKIEPVDLAYPIQTEDGRTVKLVDFKRRPTGDDLIDMDDVSGGNARTAFLVARLNGELTPDDVRRMDAADFLMCQNRIEGFLAYAPPTSAKSPATSRSSSTGSRPKSGD